MTSDNQLSTDTDNLESRLLNWARAQRDGKSFGHCRSIEHRYDARSDEGEDVIVGETDYTGEIDQLDAAIVNRAWLNVHYLNRMVIAYHYIKREKNVTKVCVTLGLRVSQYDAVMSRGKFALNRYLQLNHGGDMMQSIEVR